MYFDVYLSVCIFVCLPLPLLLRNSQIELAKIFGEDYPWCGNGLAKNGKLHYHVISTLDYDTRV